MYLIMSIVICLAVYSVLVTTNSISRTKTISNLNGLIENVDIETSRAVDLDLPGVETNFYATVQSLVSYMERSNPDTGALIMKDEGTGATTVVNNLEQGVYIITQGKKRYLAGNKEKIEAKIGINNLPIGRDKDISSGHFKFNYAQGVGEVDLEDLKENSGLKTENADIICDAPNKCELSISIVIIAFKKDATDKVEVKNNGKSRSTGRVGKDS